MVALDTSLLAYAVNRYAPEHARAVAVVEGLVNGDAPWALPWPVVEEFLDLVTHPHAVARPLSREDAWGFMELVLSSPTVRPLGPTERHSTILAEVLRGLPPGPGAPGGLRVAALLREHGVRDLLSTDPGMRRYAFLSVRDPLRGEDPRTEPAARRYRRLSLPARTRA